MLQTSPYSFTMFDSKIPAAENDYTYATFEEFFSEKYDGMARLMYAASIGPVLEAVRHMAN